MSGDELQFTNILAAAGACVAILGGGWLIDRIRERRKP